MIKPKTMDFRQRLEQSRLNPATGEIPVEEESSYVYSYFATQKNKNPACIEFRLADGVRKAIPYSYITELTYHIDKGIEILTSTKYIIITGRNLGVLFDHLAGYRVRYVQVHTGIDFEEEEGAFVKEIAIADVNE